MPREKEHDVLLKELMEFYKLVGGESSPSSRYIVESLEKGDFPEDKVPAMLELIMESSLRSIESKRNLKESKEYVAQLGESLDRMGQSLLAYCQGLQEYREGIKRLYSTLEKTVLTLKERIRQPGEYDN